MRPSEEIEEGVKSMVRTNMVPWVAISGKRVVKSGVEWPAQRRRAFRAMDCRGGLVCEGL